ncbi:Crp/Fnr family transcriptional regulator [Bradyrhizobium sp. CCBAU 53380]|uniref:Crp/Fnr family transcriptional regulator n=1 Tax=Bradyrhizobium sp. CCBAU 53380 TaxID=1325117 RepID=UPI002304B17D|nr:Crp/Fnr family transcriptional regulator [Bradyrhizobium sp. CCBAU 53380]MDA9420941.1 hypothetical protein [Bradyrhizobium sp. CCBAU 53380]
MGRSAKNWTESSLPDDHGFYTYVLPLLPRDARRGVRLLEVPAAATLFASDATPERIFYVLAGEVWLVRRSRSGERIVLHRSRNGFIAEPSLFDFKYDCEAVAIEPSQLVSIPRKEFVESLRDGLGGHFSFQWVQYLLRELRTSRAKAERLSLKTAAERIIHYIDFYGHHGNYYLSRTKKVWAAELGLTHEALYRALAQMKKRGQLTADGKWFALRRGRKAAITRRVKSGRKTL